MFCDFVYLFHLGAPCEIFVNVLPTLRYRYRCHGRASRRRKNRGCPNASEHLIKRTFRPIIPCPPAGKGYRCRTSRRRSGVALNGRVRGLADKASRSFPSAGLLPTMFTFGWNRSRRAGRARSGDCRKRRRGLADGARLPAVILIGRLVRRARSRVATQYRLFYYLDRTIGRIRFICSHDRPSIRSVINVPVYVVFSMGGRDRQLCNVIITGATRAGVLARSSREVIAEDDKFIRLRPKVFLLNYFIRGVRVSITQFGIPPLDGLSTGREWMTMVCQGASRLCIVFSFSSSPQRMVVN